MSLDAAKLFSIGPVGFAAVVSDEETAFRAILNGKKPRVQFLKLVSNANPAGQMYGLLGLKLLRDPEFEKKFAAFSSSASELGTMEGCEVMPVSMGSVAESIRSGKYQ